MLMVMMTPTDPLPEPTLLRALDGSWLALTPPNATVRYGAQGRTREEARAAFTAAGARIWSALSGEAR